MLPTLLFTAIALAGSAEETATCSPARLNACAEVIRRDVQTSQLRAYISARDVADSITAGGRVYAPSELTEFYAMAAWTALRLRNSYTSGGERAPGDPSDIELDTRMREWAQMRCRIDRAAQWPVGVGLADQETLDALCAPEEEVSQTTTRQIWLDGEPIAGGVTVQVAVGSHVVQYLDGTAVVTLVAPVAAGTSGFGVPGVPRTPTEKRRRSPARWPLAIGGAALVGAGAGGLYYWGSQLVPTRNEDNRADQNLVLGLSYGAVALGGGSMVSGLFLAATGPAPALSVSGRW